MSDKSSDTSTGAPGAGAGDAAHTTQIPRISREPQKSAAQKPAAPKNTAEPKAAEKTPVPEKTPTSEKPAAPEKPAAKKAAPATAKKAAAPSTTSQTDKGRPRPAAARGTVSPSSSSAKSGSAPTSRNLSSSEYARTTSQSPSSTAVIPAVKDGPAPSSTRKTAASAGASTRNAAPTPQATSPAAVGSNRAATLRLSHVEPWSVTRMAFAISVAMMVVSVVAVTIFWVVLEVTGIWDQIDGSVTSVLSDDSSSFSITDYLGFGRLVGLSLVLSALNVIIMTVLATVAAHLYNLAAQLMGGFEVTYTSQD